MPYYIGDVIKESKKLVIRTPEEFKKTGIDVKIKTRVDSVDPKKGSLSLSDGTSLPYDFLVMATGAEAIRLDIPGRDLEGVYVFRDLRSNDELLNVRAQPVKVIYLVRVRCLDAPINFGLKLVVLDKPLEGKGRNFSFLTQKIAKESVAHALKIMSGFQSNSCVNNNRTQFRYLE